MTATIKVDPTGRTAGRRARLGPRRHQPGALGSWLVTISLAVLVFSASLLLGPALTAGGWIAPGALVVAAVLASSAFVRSLTGSLIAAGAAGLVGALVVVTIALEPTGWKDLLAVWPRTVLGIVQQLGSDAPPLTETPILIAAVLVVIAVVTLLCDFFVFALRGRVSAVLPILVFPAIPVVLGISDVPRWPYFVLALAFGAYLYCVSSWHQRVSDDELLDAGSLVDRRGAAGLVGSLAVVAAGTVFALVAGIVLPQPAGIPGLMLNAASSLSTNRVNPLLDLGQDLRRDAPVTVLQYATTRSDGQLPYLSLMSLDTIDGTRDWAPSTFDGSGPDVEAADLPLPTGLDPTMPFATYSSNVLVEPGVSAYLPQPGRAQDITGLTTEYRLDPTTGDIREEADEALGQRYAISSVMVAAPPSLLQQLPTEVPAGFEAYTTLPEGPATDRIRAALDGVVTPGQSPYLQALELQSWFTGGDFVYSETAPVENRYDGTNVDVVAAFLEQRAGYCVHFASSMAIMGRMLGIPTRIQVGFTPGEPTAKNGVGQTIYTVTSSDLHSWAEFYLDGLGWVPFETTPSDGLGNLLAVGGDPLEQAPDSTAGVPPQPTPTGGGGEEPGETTEAPSESPTPPESTTPAPTDDPAATDDPDAAPALPDRTIQGFGLVAAILVLGLLVVFAAPGVMRSLIRSRRRAAIVSGSAPPDGPGSAAVLAWQEVLDEAADHGSRVSAGAVAGAQASRLGTTAAPGDAGADGADDGPSVADVRAAVDRLRTAYEVALFARPGGDVVADGTQLWADVVVIESGMRAAAASRTRFRAVVTPASLRTRRRGAPRRPAAGDGRRA